MLHELPQFSPSALAYHAPKSCVFVGLTGSPIQIDAADGHRLLRVVKGVH